MYCAKELTRYMATLTTADWEKMVRLWRSLKNRPTVQLWYKFQETPCQLETFSDTDWAGCSRTRSSTTGGYTVAGSHLIKMCCKTQAVVALSSAEAEVYGLVRASAKNNGTHIDVQRPRHAYERSGIGRCERSLRHCGPTGIGQIEASEHQLFVDPRESCQGRLELQESGWCRQKEVTCSRKPCRGMKYRATSTLSSQFVQNEISVNYVGARPNGVTLPRILQEVGLASDRKLAAWTRTDMAPEQNARL